MYKRNILDCTLRDGGYINNWQFTYKTTQSVLQALVDSGIDYVECGYISDHMFLNEETTYFNSLEEINNIIRKLSGDVSKFPVFCLMINMGEIDINNIPDNYEGNLVYTFRFAFHKKDREEAFIQAKQLIEKGYDVFVQPMVTQLYSDRELIETIEKFNVLDSKAMYIVDSFGNMKTDTFKRLLYLFHNNMREDLWLGYHSHNNLQLAYSNAIIFLESEIKRDIFLDSSIFGMGRGAGNLNTELVSEYMNDRYNATYSIEPLLEVMDAYLQKIHQKHYWGYSIEHYLSATLNCHPNNATYLLQKKNLTVVEIKRILDSIPKEKKNQFKREELQQYVLEYLSKNKSLPNDLFDNIVPKCGKVFVIASGPSVKEYQDDINTEISNSSDSLTIALNHIPTNIPCDYYFFSNQKRYKAFEIELDPNKLVVSSNIELNPSHQDVAILDFKQLYNEGISPSRNVCILLMNYLTSAGVKEIVLAGLDGYDVNSEQKYSYDISAGIFDKEMMLKENDLIKEALLKFVTKSDVRFLTPSIFKNELPMKVCGVIPARYKSSRFEGKPLALIAGVPMIKHTYNQALKSTQLNKLVVATDSKEIYDFCIKENMGVVMTSEKCLTGTDRVAEVAKVLDYDFYINIQGDEPVIDPKAIDTIIEAYRVSGEKYIAYNLYKHLDNVDETNSSNSIKVIVNTSDELMYMSRLPVPFSKSATTPTYNKQVCVYGFTKAALKLFSENVKTINEQYEDIEILRFMDLGYKVKMVETDYDSIAVDVPEDIKKVEQFLNA